MEVHRTLEIKVSTTPEAKKEEGVVRTSQAKNCADPIENIRFYLQMKIVF